MTCWSRNDGEALGSDSYLDSSIDSSLQLPCAYIVTLLGLADASDR